MRLKERQTMPSCWKINLLLKLRTNLTTFSKPVCILILEPALYRVHLYCHVSSGKLTIADLDERAFEALKEFPTDSALDVLNQFVASNLDHVSNKSAYLCGMMKTYKQKQKLSTSNSTPSAPKGPDEEKIKVFIKWHFG